jgi:hypothetical protein
LEWHRLTDRPARSVQSRKVEPGSDYQNQLKFADSPKEDENFRTTFVKLEDKSWKMTTHPIDWTALTDRCGPSENILEFSIKFNSVI